MSVISVSPVIGQHRLVYLNLGRADNNVLEVINEWGAYAGVVPQTIESILGLELIYAERLLHMDNIVSVYV